MLDSTFGTRCRGGREDRKAIELDPSLPEQSRRLAEILAKSGQPDRAQAALRDALRTDPYDDDSLGSRRPRVRPKRANCPKPFTISKEPSGCAPDMRRISTISRWRWSAPTGSTRRRSARKTRCGRIRICADAHELLGGLFDEKAAVARGRPRVPASARVAARFESRALAIGQRARRAGGRRRRGANTARGGPRAAMRPIAQQAAQALRQIGAR